MKTASPVDLMIGQALAACARTGHSGIVTAVRGKLKRLFCVDGRRLVWAASNVIEEQFSEFLLERDLLSPGDLADAGRQAAANEIKLARWLHDEAAVEPALLVAALEDHVSGLLFSTLDWPDGEAVLARGRPALDGELTVNLNCRTLLFEYAARLPDSLERLRQRLGSARMRPRVVEAAVDGPTHAELEPHLLHLLGCCDGLTPAEEVVERGAVDGAFEAAWRALYGARLAGLVEPAQPQRDSEREREEELRAELLARTERANTADHYGVLQVNPTAARPAILEAYYALARRFHPDRFRSGKLEDLLAQAEAYFAQVTEAYNTLYDPALRRSYDLERTEDKARPTTQDTEQLARENLRMGLSLLAKGRLKDAATSLENAVQLSPRNARMRLELGRLLARNPRMRVQAEEHLTEVNRLDPSLADGYYELGTLYAKSDRREEAVEMLLETLRWQPGHLEAGAALARLDPS